MSTTQATLIGININKEKQYKLKISAIRSSGKWSDLAYWMKKFLYLSKQNVLVIVNVLVISEFLIFTQKTKFFKWQNFLYLSEKKTYFFKWKNLSYVSQKTQLFLQRALSQIYLTGILNTPIILLCVSKT